MITEKEFTDYLTQYQIFDKALDRLSEALSGSKYGLALFETDWGDAVGKMLDIFLDSHLTVDGADWVGYYLFEDIEDKKVVVKTNDLFNGEVKTEYHLNSIKELWDFLITNPAQYFKNAE